MSRAATDQGSAYPEPGEILEDKYEIQEVLGTGAMGAVVKARHLLRKVPVALKFMSPEIVGKPGVVDRFLNEGVAASKIDSEHVVKVFDVSKLPSGVPYIVMEFLEGEDVAAIMRRAGGAGLSEVPRAIHIALQILSGLSVAHAANIVHRDMKPANCFVTGRDGDPDFIKIVDFGISKVRKTGDQTLELTQAGSSLGTPLYMSPEQARSPKDVDARSDLYSAAAILYELLAGKPPFFPESGAVSELFVMLGTEEPPSLEDRRDDLPDGLWQAIRRGLAKQPDERYQTAVEMAEALAPFADERSDYLLAKLLRRTSEGRKLSFRPPPQAQPVSDTMAMPEAPDGPATPFEGGELDPTVDSRPADAAPHVAPGETAEGTVRDASRPSLTERRGGTTLVWAVAVVGVLATAVAAWALGQVTAESPAAPTVESEPAPAPTREPAPTTTSTATASAPPAPTREPAPPPQPAPPPPQPAPPEPQMPAVPAVPDSLDQLGRD